MPSIFTRARTSSTKTLKANLPDASQSSNHNQNQNPNANVPPLPYSIDEFGRVSSRNAGGVQPLPPLTPPKDKDRRAHTVSDRRVLSTTTVNLANPDPSRPADLLEDGFLQTNIAPPLAPDGSQDPLEQYGYLGHAVHVVLGLDDVQRLVEVISDELIQRGLTTPFLLSNTALDLSSNSVRRLIDAFLRSHDFLEEARFATPHTLGAVLRWGLARPIRIVSGLEQRGLIGWESYIRWRHLEHANNFSKTEFSTFVGLLPPQLRTLMLTIFPLLARLLANATSSGLTPPKLASLFGPLLFGIPTTAFHASYAAYLRSSHALEHLLLAYVRLQIAQTSSSAPPPRRLLSWVQGYPAMLAPIDSFERPRLGAKTRRVSSMRRNVRMYSIDLIRTCGSWSRGPEGVAVRESKEWSRIAPEKGRNGIDRMEPRYSDAFRKKLDLAPGVHPSTSLFPMSANSSSLSTPSLSTTSSTASTKSSLFEDPAEEAKFRSLTDMKWGEFSHFGFGDGSAAPSALKFDLTESARTQRAAKRATLTWADFSAAGFSRSDASLSATLQFTEPIAQSVQQWPNEEKEIHRKLKKNLKALPAFGWDTAPVIDGREELIEEGFLDVFCDILYGGGWIERAETTFRDCNWVLVEFKSLPSSRNEAHTSPSLGLSSVELGSPQDPRVSTSLVLFEEFVPAEYRSALLNQGNKPSRRIPGFGAFLSPAKKNQKQWQKAQTLNGRPYVVGNVPRNSQSREAEFERILAGGTSSTKVLSLNSDSPRRGPTDELSKLTINPTLAAAKSQGNLNSPGPMTPVKPLDSPTVARTASPFSPSSLRKPRFRLAVGRDSRKGMVPSEYDTVDFETRLASYSDDELNNSNRSSGDDASGDAQKNKMRERRMSKDDAWVDILVASAGKRMGNQDAEMRPRVASGPRNGNLSVADNMGGGSGGSGHSDPELASKEVAQALAAIRQHPPTDDEGDGGSDWAIRRELEKPVELREPTLDMLRHNGNGNGNGNGYGHEKEEEEEEEHMPPKRLGYFDLHPDRRPGPPRSESQLTYEGSMYSEGGSIEPAMMDGERQVDGDIEVPAFVNESPARPTHETAKTDSMTLPAAPLTIDSFARENPQSKTAQLIEMYRERERSTRPAAPAPGAAPNTNLPAVPLAPTAPLAIASKASRIPVRSSSLEGPPSVPRDVSPEPESSEFENDETDIPVITPGAVPYVVGELGRQSPGRYVHGAPLHNVIEEEEE